LNKAGAGVALAAIVLLNAVVTYMTIVFSMLSGSTFARSVTIVFVSTNVLGLLLGIVLLLRGKRVVAISVAAAVLPVSFLALAAAATQPTHLFGPIAAQGEHNWNEVVSVSTGEKVIVKRWEKGRLVGEPGHEPGILFDESRIEADLPGAGTLRWQTSLSPWLLDKAHDGAWYLIAKTMTSKSSREYGIEYRGEGTKGAKFVAYKLVNGTWERIVASDVPNEFKAPNLLTYSGIAFNPKKSFYNGPQGDLLVYVDGKMNAVAAPASIAEGGLVDLEYKLRLNHPSHPDQKKEFELTREYFDDGTRYIEYKCKPQSTDCAWVTLERGLDERFGRAPKQRMP